MKFIGFCIWCVCFIDMHADELKVGMAACKAGEAKSCFEVGVKLITGENAKYQKKKDLGLDYIRQACKYGIEKACDRLGEHYYSDKHYQAARPYLVLLCDRGDKNACEAVGTMYRDAQEVKQDDSLARTYYEKACSFGSADACINIAIMYRGGFGVKINRLYEKKYYKKSCEEGSEVGCNRYRKMDNEDKSIEEPSLLKRLKSLFKLDFR